MKKTINLVYEYHIDVITILFFIIMLTRISVYNKDIFLPTRINLASNLLGVFFWGLIIEKKLSKKPIKSIFFSRLISYLNNS